jgi:NADH/NAD ratio-sensing transcriptional regulator Rex
MKINSPRLRLAAYRGVALRSNGAQRLTSVEISEATGVNATQVRRDLSAVFGDGGGTRGWGYRPAVLIERLKPHVRGVVVEVEQAERLASLARRGLR